jgi:sugar O-acyltransferase (sialic acid O-acetyltransferase NeuD family)
VKYPGVTRCVILGGGGHACVLIDALQVAGSMEIAGILDPDSSRWGDLVLGFPILGSDKEWAKLVQEGVTHFVIGLAGVAPNQARRDLFERAVAAGLSPWTVRHPAAVISSHTKLGPGVQVLAGAVINARACVGRGVIVNTAAVIEHDTVLGEFSHVAPRACLAGGVEIGPGAFVGAGATVIQGVRVGANSLIAAGAVVVRDVPPGAQVSGVPARPMV